MEYLGTTNNHLLPLLRPKRLRPQDGHLENTQHGSGWPGKSRQVVGCGRVDTRKINHSYLEDERANVLNIPLGIQGGGRATQFRVYKVSFGYAGTSLESNSRLALVQVIFLKGHHSKIQNTIKHDLATSSSNKTILERILSHLWSYHFRVNFGKGISVNHPKSLVLEGIFRTCSKIRTCLHIPLVSL